MLTDEQKLRLEIDGYIILRNVLSQDEINELNKIDDDRDAACKDVVEQQREFFICRWGKPFLDLMSHHKIVPYIEYLCGSKFRLDHDYCIFMNPGSPASRMHGGEEGFEDFWVRQKGEEIRSGLTVAMYFLNDVETGNGGFVCIPGSHRENFLSKIPEDVLYQKRIPDYIKQPTFRAGDVIIFMEGLIHGTSAWQGNTQRRVLLYKYCPGHICWIGNSYSSEEFSSVSPLQKNLMRPAYVELIKQPNGVYRTPTIVSN